MEPGAASGRWPQCSASALRWLCSAAVSRPGTRSALWVSIGTLELALPRRALQLLFAPDPAPFAILGRVACLPRFRAFHVARFASLAADLAPHTVGRACQIVFRHPTRCTSASASVSSAAATAANVTAHPAANPTCRSSHTPMRLRLLERVRPPSRRRGGPPHPFVTQHSASSVRVHVRLSPGRNGRLPRCAPCRVLSSTCRWLWWGFISSP